MTYQNIGYWIGQANDTSTGRHPTGWSNGQRWSETAGEWIPMYDQMVAERDAWITNYNNSQAALTAMTNDRNYWQHTVAHNDPNVWDNRYNAGYGAGDAAGYSRGYTNGAASKTTQAVGSGTMLVGVGGLPNPGSYSADLIAVYAPRSGLAQVSCIAISNPSEDVTLHVFRNGALVANGQNGAGGWNVHFAVQCNVNVNQGDYISIRGWGDPGNQSSIGSMYLLCTVGNV